MEEKNQQNYINLLNLIASRLGEGRKEKAEKKEQEFM